MTIFSIMIAIYLLLGVVIFTLELRRRMNGAPIDGLTIFNVYYFVLYVFVPINVIAFGEVVVRQKYAFERFGSGDWWTALVLLLTYMLFVLGYKLCLEPEAGRKTTASALESNGLFDVEKITKVAIITLVIGVAALVVNVIQLGGFMDTVCKAALTRAGQFTSDSDFVFIRHFMPFVSIAFMLVVSLLIYRHNSKLKPTTIEKYLGSSGKCVRSRFVH